MALLSGLIDKLKGLFDPVIKPAIGLFNLVVHTRDTILQTKDAVLSTSQNILDVVDLVRNFSLKANFKSRVVNVPKVIDNFENIVSAFKDIAAKLKEFKTMFKEAAGEAETTDLTDDVQGLEDLQAGAAKLGTRFASAFEKGLGILAVILMVAGNLQKQFDSISSLIGDVKTILEDLDNLDGLFLPQKNARKTLQLSTGQSIRIRVGNLHGETGT